MRTKPNLTKSTIEVEDDIHFSDIFDIEEIQRIQDLFSDATSVASIITYPDGTPITNPSNFTRLCNNIIRKTEKGLVNCFKSDKFIGGKNSDSLTIRRCLSAGLWDGGAGITVGGKHIANWLIGQVRNEELDEQRLMDYATEIGADKTEFMSALSEVPVMSSEKFKQVSEMLFAFAREISEKGYNNLLLKKQIAKQEKTNELLQKSQEALSITLHSIGDGVLSSDSNGLILDMNPVAEKLCGWKLADALGKPLIDVFKIVNSETRLPVANPVNTVLESGKIIGLSKNTLLISRDGSEYQIADSVAPIKNKEGIITGVVLVFSDVTEKYKAETALSESERSKTVLLSNLPGMSYRCRLDRKWTKEFVSNGCLSLTGYEAADFINNKTLSFNDLILPEYREHLWTVWEKAVQDKGLVCEEYKIRTSDNQIKWVWEQGIPIYNSAGEVEALEGLIIDITERKQAEEMLIKERLMLRALIDNIPETIYSKDLASRKTLSNKAETALLGGKSESDILGKDDFEFFPKELAEKFISDDRVVMQTGKPMLNIEESFYNENGKLEWLLTSKIPLRDNNNQIVGLIGISRNITERKQAEETIQNERLLLRTIIDNIPDLIYTKDLTSRKTLANIAEVNILGAKTEAEVLGKDDFDFYPKELAEKFYADDQLIFQTGKPILNNEESIVDKNGLKRWMLFSKLLLRDKNDQIIGLLSIGRDITDRKQVEEILQNERLLLRTVIENIPYTIYAKDLAGRKTLANKAETDFLGVNSEFEVLGKDDFDFYPKEIAEKFLADDQLMIQTGLPDINKESFEFDANGNKYWLLSSKLPLYNKDNQIIGLVGITHDITYRKIMEEALLENENFLKETQVIAQLGTYKLDIINDTWTSSEVLNSIFGIEADYDKTLESWTFLIHPESQKEMSDYFKQEVLGTRSRFDKEYKIIRQNDKVERWIHGLGELLYNYANEPIKMIGTIQDITDRKEAENVLHDLHWRLESIVEGAHVGTLEWNIQTGAMVFNDVWAENLGFTAAEVNFACSIWGNQTWEMFTHPDDVKLANEMLERHFSGELPYHDVECRMMHKDGHWVWIQQRGRVTKRTDDGKPLLMFGTHTDITVRKQVEESLRLSEEKYRTLIENMGEGVVFLNDEETFVFANQAAEKIFGVDKGELLGLCLYNFLPDKNIEIVKNQTQKRIQGESSVYEHEIVLKDGSKRYILVTATPSFDDKKFIGTFSIFRDITERKQAEVDLHVSEALYRNLVERLPDGIYKSTHEGKFIDVNPALVKMLGYNSKEELMAIDIKKQLYFEEVDRESLILEEKQSEMEVFRLKKKDGSEIWVEDHGWYNTDDNGEIQFHEGIMRDVTERKLADNQLRKSRSEFKDLFDFAPIGYHEIDSHGNIVRINETELNMVGYSADELLGKHISMLSSDVNQSRRAVKAKLDGTYVPLESFERLFRRKDGTTVPVLVNDRILKANDGSITGIRSAVQDITEFKQIDKAMRESELKFRHYIDFAPHGVFVTDDKGNYIEVNSAASKITGYSKTELLAMNSSTLIAEESTEKFVSHIQRVVTKGYASDEYAIIKKDKTIRFCTLDSVKLSDNRFLGFVVDITDRKQAEEVLRESEIFLKEIQTIAQLGNCTIDIISGKWEGSEILDSILGIDTAYEKSLKGLTSLLKPEWLQSMTDYFLNEIVQKQVKFDKKFKIIRLNDKEERWVHGRGELKFDNFNQPVNMIITIQDITERKLAKETLQNERLLLRSIIDIIPDSIYTKDLAGHKTLANLTEVRFLRANTEADVLGKDDFDFYAKELADKFYENDQMVINTGKPLINKEEYMHDENGQKRWVLSSKLPLRDKDNQIIGLLGTSHDITIRKSMEEALSETQEQLKKFAAHLQNVREEERIGLAREIHDELGQILIAIKIDVGMLKQKVLKSVDSTAATDILTKFDSLFGLVDNTINTARKIMTDLRPEVLYLLGFIESAKLQTSNFQERHHISCKFESTIPKLEISSQKSVAMFRILQEALNNIAKHARATDVNVKLTDHSDILILEIKDNGIGFDVDQKGKLDSYGLIGMKERAFLLDAELIITADATKGTCIRVEMPYSEKITISE